MVRSIKRQQSKSGVSSQRKLKSRSPKSSKRVSRTNNLSSRKNNRKQLGGSFPGLTTVIQNEEAYVQNLPDNISWSSFKNLLKANFVEIAKKWRSITSLLSKEKDIFKIVPLRNTKQQIILLCGKRKDNKIQSLQYLTLGTKPKIETLNHKTMKVILDISKKIITRETGINIDDHKDLKEQLILALGLLIDNNQEPDCIREKFTLTSPRDGTEVAVKNNSKETWHYGKLYNYKSDFNNNDFTSEEIEVFSAKFENDMSDESKEDYYLIDHGTEIKFVKKDDNRDILLYKNITSGQTITDAMNASLACS